MKKKLLFILFIAILAAQAFIIGSLGLELYQDASVSRLHVTSDVRTEIATSTKESRYQYFYELNVDNFERNSDGSRIADPVTPSHTLQGFRERFIYPLTAATGTVRIIALGDSNTYGLGIRIEDSFTEVLEDMLNARPLCSGTKYEVINLGVPGYDLLYSEERFRLSGQQFKPDAVLWYVYPNDFTEYKDKQLELMMDLIRSGKKVDATDGENTVREVSVMYSKGFIEDLQLSAIEHMRTYYPGTIILFSGSSYLNIVQHIKVAIMRWKDGNVFALFPFSEVPQKYYLPNGHANETGNKFIADALYKQLADHPELLPQCAAR